MNPSDKSYLIYMAVRLLEMHRLLKSTGSIYLHCDPTMSHYLKLVMDAIFRKLYGEQDGECNGCHTHFKPQNLTVDYIIPKSKGGPIILETCNYCAGTATQ